MASIPAGNGWTNEWAAFPTRHRADALEGFLVTDGSRAIRSTGWSRGRQRHRRELAHRSGGFNPQAQTAISFKAIIAAWRRMAELRWATAKPACGLKEICLTEVSELARLTTC
jgi:hypothetical protein